MKPNNDPSECVVGVSIDAVIPAEQTQPFSKPKSRQEVLAGFLWDATRGGLFPLVGYSVGDDEGEGLSPVAAKQGGADEDDDTDLVPPEGSIQNNAGAGLSVRIRVLTTSIADLSYALEVLEKATYQGYNLGKRLWPSRLKGLSEQNPHVFSLKEVTVDGYSNTDFLEIGRVIQRFGAPFVKEKGFALVDICSFSRLGHSEQLSSLYSLTNMLDTAVRRSWRFCKRLNVRNRFGKNSTGDGYYFWHEGLSGSSDVATFITLLCLMSQCEMLRRTGFPMQIRCSYFIGSAFLFYDAYARSNPNAPATNAIGAATNGAARLLTAAQPGQLLINDFQRRGQGGETMTPEVLISQCNELFREEEAGAGKLTVLPKKRLRVSDKHGDIWYCFNLHGTIPHKAGKQVQQITIGLEPDESPLIESVLFGAPKKPKGI